MVYEGWNFFVLKSHAGDVPPTEWVDLLTKLKLILTDRIINKIEGVSFVAKGHRTSRWLLETSDPEYCTKEETLKIAKKLTFLFLNTINSVGISEELKDFFPEENYPMEITKCPLCNKEIDVSDFDKDGRIDGTSIHIGHKIPLSSSLNSHNENNVYWTHRVCNDIKGEKNMKETIDYLMEIIRSHIKI